MTTWITSDQHYGHIMLAKKRGFASTYEMDEALIQRHNECVQPEETVYYLGDLSFHPEEITANILERLNGKKILVWGNHDHNLGKSGLLRDLFERSQSYFELMMGPSKVCMSHFPMLVWNKHHFGSVMLHGHCHGSMQYPFVGRIKDVGVDCNNLTPFSIEQIVDDMQSIIPQHLDHHKPRF